MGTFWVTRPEAGSCGGYFLIKETALEATTKPHNKKSGGRGQEVETRGGKVATGGEERDLLAQLLGTHTLGYTVR